MQAPKWLRRAAYGGVAAITALGGVSALAATAAHATSTFTFTRIGGADRYATAGLFDQASGSPAAITFADGLPGHQSDALAASGYGGVNTLGMLLTDNTNTIPANTQSALTSNGVKTVTILGGTAAVSSAQQTALQSAGFTVTRIGGNTRFDTMQALDDTLAGKTGKDSSGNNVGILASGNDNHLVDALSAGGVAYGQKFPVILTDSSSSTLSPQASEVISALNIKHVIVVGGTAAVPASQYASLPNGATATVEAGADRSATSKVFSDYAMSQGWAGNTRMELARGDDGADALGSADYAGANKLPTCVTNSPSDVGSCTAFATEHASTLAGPSVIAGGTAAVPDSEASAVATAGGGTFPQSSSTSVAASPASSTVQNGKTTTITATVTNNGTPVQGATVNFTTSGTGCGSVSPTSAVTNSGGQATTTYTAGSAAGSCTVTATESSTGKSGTTTVTTTTASTGATNLPQLVSASVLGEFNATTANNATTFPGTLVQYVFGQDVSGDTLSATGFHTYTADGQWRINGANTCLGGAGTCAFHDPSNKNAVDVYFMTANAVANNPTGALTAAPDLTTASGAATLTLATVGDQNDTGGPAVTAPAPSGNNVVGSAPIGSASTATLTAGTTAAPDPESIGSTTRLGSLGVAGCGAGNCSAIDVTFDQAAYDVNAGPDATHFDIVYTSGVNGANTGPGSQEKACTAAGTGDATASGGAVPGGNGTATLTIVCPNPSTVTAGTAMPVADIARIVVQPSAVASVNTVAADCPATGGATTAGTAGFCNPLEVTDAPNASDGNPTLTSVTLEPNTPSGNSTAVFTFDQALNALATAQVYNQNGSTTVCATAPVVNPGNSSQWACTFGTAAALNSAVGGSVPQGQATSFATGRTNSDTELGASNPTSTSVTPGKIAAPQLTSVHAGMVTGTFGTVPGAVYTFNEPVNATAGKFVPGDLVLWDSDGTQLVCTAATVGTGTTSSQVTCTSYKLFGTATPATSNQITTAVFGGSDWQAVQGTGVSEDADWSPEGGFATS